MLELVNKFSEITAVSTLKDAHALIRNVISSGKCTEKLVFLSGEKTCSRLPNKMEFDIFNDQSYVGSTKLLDFYPRRVRMGQF